MLNKKSNLGSEEVGDKEEIFVSRGYVTSEIIQIKHLCNKMEKLTSNRIETSPNINLAGFPDIPLQKSCVVHQESKISCVIESIPPMKSKSMFHIFHPSVLFRRKFSSTCGQYLTTVMATLMLARVYIKSNQFHQLVRVWEEE